MTHALGVMNNINVDPTKPNCALVYIGGIVEVFASLSVQCHFWSLMGDVLQIDCNQIHVSVVNRESFAFFNKATKMPAYTDVQSSSSISHVLSSQDQTRLVCSLALQRCFCAASQVEHSAYIAILSGHQWPPHARRMPGSSQTGEQEHSMYRI